MAQKLVYDYYILDNEVYFELKGRCQNENILAIVSLDMWDIIAQYKWYLGKHGYPLCYELGKLTLHRFVYSHIFGQIPPSNMHVDHIDRNKLNNTNQNLRLVTPQENSFNRSTSTNTKGVKKISENNYTASISKDGTRHEIKNIRTEKEAASIYNIMAEDLFGKFAAKNDTNDDYFNNEPEIL